MNFNKTLIWSAVNKDYHPSIKDDEKTISTWMPLVKALFPGINYYCMSGFGQVFDGYVKPVLNKLFPELATLPAENCSDSETVEIEAFLPSDGYQHLGDPSWKQNLQKKLST